MTMKLENIPEAGGYIYIMGNSAKSLYIGSTENLAKRVWEHKEKMIKNSHTAKYNIDKLLYFRWFSELHSARNQEYKIKKWRRKKKIKLIEENNYLYLDLAKNWFLDLE